ncbi:MAG: UDP-N-acetylmuramate dehydrogenase [Fimbriimonas sp.]|nr:UDP-N-acetylmuramate dehydrogenase [Fimbriimonas sp.]
MSLKPYTTLRAGGAAEQFVVARSADDMASISEYAHRHDLPVTYLGYGSNVLPSDDGVPGLTVLNRSSRIEIDRNGTVRAETGCSFQDLFLKSVQSGLRGLEFAVGIPGSLGGALVSNAGAYRSCVSEFLTELEIVLDGTRQTVSPSWMEFSYRNSILRRAKPPRCALLSVTMKLPKGDPKRSYDEAREYQRQRIGKQPPSPSAGSFFKNVNDSVLAESLETLPPALKVAGVVPAGYLIEQAGMKGYRFGGAMMGRRHANFVLNVKNATAAEIYHLAESVKKRVARRFGVCLEEEVLYLGDWSRVGRSHD